MRDSTSCHFKMIKIQSWGQRGAGREVCPSASTHLGQLPQAQGRGGGRGAPCQPLAQAWPGWRSGNWMPFPGRKPPPNPCAHTWRSLRAVWCQGHTREPRSCSSPAEAARMSGQRREGTLPEAEEAGLSALVQGQGPHGLGPLLRGGPSPVPASSWLSGAGLCPKASLPCSWAHPGGFWAHPRLHDRQQWPLTTSCLPQPQPPASQEGGLRHQRCLRQRLGRCRQCPSWRPQLSFLAGRWLGSAGPPGLATRTGGGGCGPLHLRASKSPTGPGLQFSEMGQRSSPGGQRRGCFPAGPGGAAGSLVLPGGRFPRFPIL